MARLFLGIPIPHTLCEQISDFLEEIPQQSGIRWVKPKNYHVTLGFFGEVQDEIVENFQEALRVGMGNCEGFELEFHEYTFAPRGHEPRMIWIQWKKNSQFKELSHRLCTLSEQLFPQYSSRKSPIPHITLARMRSGVDLGSIPLNMGPQLPRLLVRKLVLWESLREEGGEVFYQPMLEIPLLKEGR